MGVLSLGWLKIFSDGLESIAFPRTCVSCGLTVPDKKRMLCTACMTSRFEDPNPTNESTCAEVILPNGVHFQDAMWRYDKEGNVQEMIQMLKYQGMSQVGTELGNIAGIRLNKRHIGIRIMVEPEKVLLVPVPLHPVRERNRGYNQAQLIADGISAQTGLKVLEKGVLIRRKNTISQTKFKFSKRMENLREVFTITQPEQIRGHFLILVDDVFTTGSTSFSIAKVLKETEPAGIGIFTIAQA